MALFQKSVLQKHLNDLKKEDVAAAYITFKAQFANPAKQAHIREAKEEQYQSGFLTDLFVHVLGYTLNPNPGFDLTTEHKNEKDSKKADGAILNNGAVVAVIELKGTNTVDLDHVETQAFGYKNNQKGCRYVVTSNFEKLRFYIDDSVEHVEFNLFKLTEDDFKVLYLCLQKDQLLANVPLAIKDASLAEEQGVTKKLYNDYSNFKRLLYHNILALNPQFDRLLVYKKTQKLLDRFLFILFAEDKQLLPPNSIREILKQWQQLKELDEIVPLYDRYKKYFGYMNTGHKGKQHDIFAYNGGLFAPDDVLDNIKVDDALLYDSTQALSQYDFDTEVDVNILGHIFEHSLNDVDAVTAEVEGRTLEKDKTRRKKDGVFYTPKYITKYIVENTVGKLCEEKKAELAITDDDYSGGKKKKDKKALNEKLEAYTNWLLQLTILDPACGSGAFLNQALEFLITEHRKVDELRAKLFEDAMVLTDVENHILENNLYGVDLNEESVEIAKLSLWLRTAQKGRKLSSLNKNIKNGNSLIDDPAVAGDKAFNWQEQFPNVFAKGGFDVVIGNPPYVDIKALDNELVKELFKKYKTAENRINLYSIFIEKGYFLVKDKGILSFINPNSILVNSSYTKIRELLINDMSTIIKLPDHVFEEATVETIIFEFRKNSNIEEVKAIVYQKDEIISNVENNRAKFIDKKSWKSNDTFNYNIYVSPRELELLSKISIDCIDLGEIADITLGITPYDKYKGHSPELITSRAFHSEIKMDGTYKPLISGSNIQRYFVTSEVNEYIRYGEWLGAAREERFFTEPRILVRQIVSGSPPRIYAGFTDEVLYYTQIGFGIIPKPETLSVKALLVLLNSNLINFFHKYSFLDLEKELFQKILIANCKKFPIKNSLVNSSQNIDELPTKIIEYNKRLSFVTSEFLTLLQSNFELPKPSKKLQSWYELDNKAFLAELKKAKITLTLPQQSEWLAHFNEQKQKALALKADIDKTDKEIDQLVYQLYNLTPEEIKIVEDSVG